MSLFTRIPIEIFYKILLDTELNFDDLCIFMRSGSEIYCKLRYNNYFWEIYYKTKYSKNIIDSKLGDNFKTCAKMSNSRFNLAEKIIDIIYEIKSKYNCTLYVYGGYLRDKIIKNKNFKNINICIDKFVYYNSFIRALREYHNPPYLCFDINDNINNNKIIVKNDICEIEIIMNYSSISKLLNDFDINSLYLFDRNDLRTRSTEICNSNWLTESYLDNLKNIGYNCKKKKFKFCLVNTPSLDSLIKRYNYMITLGFKFDPII